MSVMIRRSRTILMMTRRTWCFLGATFVSSLSLTAAVSWSHWGIAKPAATFVIFLSVCAIVAWMGLIASLTIDCVNRATGAWGKRILVAIKDTQPAQDCSNVTYLHDHMRR